MKTLAFAFALLVMFVVTGQTQVIKQNGGVASTISPASVNASTVTITGAGTACFTAGGLAINCASGSVTASSVTVQNAFQVSGATFTVATTGIVSAPSQPGFFASTGTVTVTHNTVQTMNYATTNFNRNGVLDASAGTGTVPTGGDGIYLVSCHAFFATNGTGDRVMMIANGASTELRRTSTPPSSSFGVALDITYAESLAAGDVRKCRLYQSSGGDLTISAGWMTMVKLW